MGYGFMNWFIDHLYTPLGTTSNYSATVDLQNSQITTAPAKPFLACCAVINLSLVTASKSKDSSASRVWVLLSQPHAQNSCHGCQLNYSAISSQPPMQSSTDWLPQLSFSYNSSARTA
jgi:hypothetical protein